jgi:hypothetical protein
VKTKITCILLLLGAGLGVKHYFLKSKMISRVQMKNINIEKIGPVERKVLAKSVKAQVAAENLERPQKKQVGPSSSVTAAFEAITAINLEIAEKFGDAKGHIVAKSDAEKSELQELLRKQARIVNELN